MRCHYCDREMHTRNLSFDGLRKTRDHYIPKSNGGSNHKSNIRWCCYLCNHLKGDMMPEQWQQFMQDNPLWWEKRMNIKCQAAEPFPKATGGLADALENGRRVKAYMDRNFPVRPLRHDEPIPIEFDDPAQQAAFEAYAKKYRHVLRVPVNEPPHPPS